MSSTGRYEPLLGYQRSRKHHGPQCNQVANARASAWPRELGWQALSPALGPTGLLLAPPVRPFSKTVKYGKVLVEFLAPSSSTHPQPPCAVDLLPTAPPIPSLTGPSAAPRAAVLTALIAALTNASSKTPDLPSTMSVTPSPATSVRPKRTKNGGIPRHALRPSPTLKNSVRKSNETSSVSTDQTPPPARPMLIPSQHSPRHPLPSHLHRLATQPLHPFPTIDRLMTNATSCPFPSGSVPMASSDSTGPGPVLPKTPPSSCCQPKPTTVPPSRQYSALTAFPSDASSTCTARHRLQPLPRVNGKADPKVGLS